MIQEYYLTLENLRLLSKELDNEFNLVQLDLNDLSAQNMNLTDSLSEFVVKFKNYLDKNIEHIKIEGKAIIEDIIIRVVSSYNQYVEFLKENGNAFIEKVELLIQKWVEKIYGLIVKTIPSKLSTKDFELVLNEVSFERTFGLKAGFKAQITELFEMIAEASFKIKTSYITKS